MRGCQCVARRPFAPGARSPGGCLDNVLCAAMLGVDQAHAHAVFGRPSSGSVVLSQAVRSLPGLAVALWLGGMACFAFLVAPAAFAALDREAAGRLVTVMFPRYYLAGVVLGAIALAGCVGRASLTGWRGAAWLPLGLVVVMLALTLYAWAVVLPAAHAAREALRAPGGSAPAEALRFARLHRLSGMLNVSVMAVGIVFLIVEATRRS